MTHETSANKDLELSATSGRKDRRRRRRMGTMPRPILPMRALWEGATRSDQERAHESAVWMLEYWLGRMSKAELAVKIDVTPLRVWQLSQLAIAGMVCGLLPQPRYRRGMSAMATDPENDPKALRQENARLRRELEVAQQLIDILKTLPGNASRELATPAERARKKESAASRRASPPGRKKATRGKGGGKKRATPPSGGRARGASSSRSGKTTRGRGDGGASSGGASADCAEVDGGSREPSGPSSA